MQKYLHAGIARILNQPDIRERILADGSEPVGNSPAAFRQYMLAYPSGPSSSRRAAKMD